MEVIRPGFTRRRKLCEGVLRCFLGVALVALALMGGAFPSSPAAADPALPYGPYTCWQGYVWRAATANDPVCVTPQRRTEVASENSLSPGRKLPGSLYCQQGFVWRVANPSDLACVLPDSRTEAAWENKNAAETLAAPYLTPRGRVEVITLRTMREGHIYPLMYVAGTGLVPNSKVEVIPYWVPYYGSSGLVTTNAQGAIPRWTELASTAAGKTCQYKEAATMVVVEYASGLVTTAGTSDLSMCPADQ